MTRSLEYIKVFCYVVKMGSISAAAEVLSISQPAVSQSIKQLENVLDVKLFYRMSKGVKLTDEGKVFHEYALRGYKEILAGEEKIRQIKNLEAGEIHIGASDMSLEFFLLPYLETFHEKYPDIKVVVSNGPTPETVEFCKTGRIDFGVISSPVENIDDCVVFPVKEIDDIFIAGNNFSDLKNKKLDYSILEQVPLIMLEQNTSTRDAIDSFLRKKDVHIHPEFELATSPMIVQFVLRNLGVGAVMSGFAKEILKKGNAFELEFDSKLPKRNLCIIIQKNKKLSGAVKRLLEVMGVRQ